MTRTIAVTAAAAVLVLCAACAITPAVDLKAGDPAPDFTLKGSDGKTYSLSDFKGKQAVVLAWFPKAFTGGWTAECKSLRESGAAIREFEAALFAASVDDADTNAKFAQSLELDYPILSDPEKTAAEAYGVLIPAVRVAYRWTFYIGADGKILRVDRDVSPKTAGADIARTLAELDIRRNKPKAP